MPWHTLAPVLLFVLICPVAGFAEIFKCVSESGELTFSQTPCGNGKVSLQVNSEWPKHDKRVDCEYARSSARRNAHQLESGADSLLEESRASRQAARRVTRAKELEKREKCRDRIRSQIDRINSRMRSGYSASQGIRLRDRRRELEQQLREC